jgi:hypothetical protein
MYCLTIVYVYGASQTFLYGDSKEEAETAYKKLETAMQEWRRFKNDTSETVTVFDSKGPAVFRLEHLASVSLSDMGAGEPDQIAWAEYNGRLMAANEKAKLAITSC